MVEWPAIIHGYNGLLYMGKTVYWLLIQKCLTTNHVFLSLRPVWNFAGHVGRLSQIMWSVHWNEHTIYPVLLVQHVNSKLESKLLLREKLERFIASRTITGMRVKNDVDHSKKNPLHNPPKRFCVKGLRQKTDFNFIFIVLLNVMTVFLKGPIQIKLPYLV